VKLTNPPISRATGETWDATNFDEISRRSMVVCSSIGQHIAPQDGRPQTDPRLFVLYRTVYGILRLIHANQPRDSTPAVPKWHGDPPDTDRSLQAEIVQGSAWVTRSLSDALGMSPLLAPVRGGPTPRWNDPAFSYSPESPRSSGSARVGLSGTSLPREIMQLVAGVSRQSAVPISLSKSQKLSACTASKSMRDEMGRTVEEDLLVDGCPRVAATAIRNLLVQWLPVSLFEGFSANFAHASESTSPYTSLEVLVTQPPASDAVLYQMASLASRGVKLVMLQHGGRYFESVPTTWEAFESRFSDLYAYWGRIQGEDSSMPTAIPLAPPRLLRLSPLRTGIRSVVTRATTAHQDWSHLLVTSEDIPQDFEMIGPHSFPGVSTRDFQLMVLRTVNQLNDGSWLLRRKPRTASWKEAGAWHGQYDLGPYPIDGLLAHAQLVLVDALFTTTFLECLAMDKPCLIAAPRQVALRIPAHQTYEILRDAGLWLTSDVELRDALHQAQVVGARRYWIARRSAVDAVRRELLFHLSGGIRSWVRLGLAARRGWQGVVDLAEHPSTSAGTST
jgi:hypothetical protein